MDLGNKSVIVDSTTTREEILANETARDLVKEIERENSRYQDIEGRLHRRFGYGDRPEVRKRFYRKLQQACDKYGAEAYEQLTEAARDAASAANPGRFFCAAVKSRLQVRDMDVWTERLF